MSVSPLSRRGGLASALIRQVEEFAAEKGFDLLVLSTASIMAPAIELYHRNGFQVCLGMCNTQCAIYTY